MQHGKVGIDETVGCQWSWMFTILDNTHTSTHTHQVDYTNIYAKDKHHVAFSKCGSIFYMLLQGVWQITCNQTLCIQWNNCQH